LNTLLESDEEAKELYAIYKKLNSSVSSLTHLTPDDIANYIIFEKGLSASEAGGHKLLSKIEEHIQNCTVCKEEYALLVEEYNSLDTHLNRIITDVPLEEKTKSGFLSSIFTSQNSFTRYAFAFSVFFVFVYVSAFMISDFTTPAYFNSASIKSEREFYTTRSRGTDDFQKSLSAFDNDNFEKGIKYLEKDIKDNSSDNTIFYSHYILGIAYLQSAEKDYLGLFKTYDNNKVEKGIENLKLAITKNTSGNFENVKLNAYYYLGKGYLMLNDVTAAKNYLKKVVKNKGSKMKEALILLDKVR